jgi:hypothetical protein
MPTFPPKIDVYTEADMKQMTEGFRAGLMLGADQAANTAAALHPRIVATLRQWGLDGTNRLGVGSDANKAANRIARQLQRMAEHMTTAAFYGKAANQDFVRLVVVPVAAARAEQKNGSNVLKV